MFKAANFAVTDLRNMPEVAILIERLQPEGADYGASTRRKTAKS